MPTLHAIIFSFLLLIFLSGILPNIFCQLYICQKNIDMNTALTKFLKKGG